MDEITFEGFDKLRTDPQFSITLVNLHGVVNGRKWTIPVKLSDDFLESADAEGIIKDIFTHHAKRILSKNLSENSN